jgi:hypothetical protein
LLLAAPFEHGRLRYQVQEWIRYTSLALANNVQRLTTKEQLCDYLHQAAGHPVKKTWLAAIKAGEYATWPGLTYEQKKQQWAIYIKEGKTLEVRNRNQIQYQIIQ